MELLFRNLEEDCIKKETYLNARKLFLSEVENTFAENKQKILKKF